MYPATSAWQLPPWTLTADLEISHRSKAFQLQFQNLGKGAPGWLGSAEHVTLDFLAASFKPCVGRGAYYK